MRDERIIEEMAKLDRVEIIMCNKKRVPSEAGLMKCMKVFDSGGWFSYEPIHNYHKDHNAVQRVIDSMDDTIVFDYLKYLVQIVRRDAPDKNGLWKWEASSRATKATPRQKCEAILKVKGAWYEGD